MFDGDKCVCGQFNPFAAGPQHVASLGGFPASSRGCLAHGTGPLSRADARCRRSGPGSASCCCTGDRVVVQRGCVGFCVRCTHVSCCCLDFGTAGCCRRAWWMAAIPLAVGVIPPAALIFAVGVLPFNALAIIAILGQQMEGAMSTVTLSGRRIRDELVLRHGEVEAAVALGFEWHAARNSGGKSSRRRGGDAHVGPNPDGRAGPVAGCFCGHDHRRRHSPGRRPHPIVDPGLFAAGHVECRRHHLVAGLPRRMDPAHLNFHTNVLCPLAGSWATAFKRTKYVYAKILLRTAGNFAPARSNAARICASRPAGSFKSDHVMRMNRQPSSMRSFSRWRSMAIASSVGR